MMMSRFSTLLRFADRPGAEARETLLRRLRPNPNYLFLPFTHQHWWEGDEARAHSGHAGIIMCFALHSPNGHCRADDLKVQSRGIGMEVRVRGWGYG